MKRSVLTALIAIANERSEQILAEIDFAGVERRVLEREGISFAAPKKKPWQVTPKPLKVKRKR